MSGPTPVTTGEFAGWKAWDTDPYEVANGPFVTRERDDGEIECAMRVEPRHCNGGGAAHGGLLMTFADFCLFCIGAPGMNGQHGVTVSCTSQFLGPAFPGELLNATGKITRAGGALVFVDVDITAEGRPVLSVSGIIKKLKPKA